MEGCSLLQVGQREGLHILFDCCRDFEGLRSLSKTVGNFECLVVCMGLGSVIGMREKEYGGKLDIY